MANLIQFINDNGADYGITLAEVVKVLTPEEMENLGSQSEDAMATFFAEQFDSLFDQRFGY